jgi:hypothetical protein
VTHGFLRWPLNRSGAPCSFDVSLFIESSLEPVDLEIAPCHSPQLEPNARGGHRQCVWPRSRY